MIPQMNLQWANLLGLTPPAAMNPISKFSQSLREYLSIQGTILCFPALSQSIYFFLISIGSIFVFSFVQRAIYGSMCWAFTL